MYLPDVKMINDPPGKPAKEGRGPTPRSPSSAARSIQENPSYSKDRPRQDRVTESASATLHCPFSHAAATKNSQKPSWKHDRQRFLLALSAPHAPLPKRIGLPYSHRSNPIFTQSHRSLAGVLRPQSSLGFIPYIYIRKEGFFPLINPKICADAAFFYC